MADAADLFRVGASSYDRFMGRYSVRLAPLFAELAGVRAGQRVLDVGCGPGALTAELVARAGAAGVTAVDPSEPFVEAVRERLPGVEARVGSAETLPFDDDAFDAALAQLVVHFLADPERGVLELRRVTRSGGTVAACTWDSRSGMRMLRLFWDAALTVDAEAPDEAETRRFSTEAELHELFAGAGLADVRTTALDLEARYDGFDDLWDSVTAGAGPVGAYARSLATEQADAVRGELRRRVGDPGGPFSLAARAWAVVGTV